MLAPKFRPLALGLAALLAGRAVVWWHAPPRTHAGDAKGSRLKALLGERLAILREVASRTAEAHRGGHASFAEVFEANQAVCKAELDACETDRERVAVLEKLLADAKEYERRAAAQAKAGAVPAGGALKAKVTRLDVEIALERARGK